jgi:1-acyl-sn-glycerol-3-phosphate acyltransferase
MSIPLAHALADYALSLPADECQKRLPRFLAKLELFDAPILGRLLSSLQQIPVNRLAGKTALQTAEQALAAGHSVVVYPEATTTKDPDLWPCPITPEQDARFDGRYRHGAVKMAAKTGSLIIPTMQWLDRTNRLRRPTAHIHFGEPIRLSADANPADETRSLMLTVAKMMAEARSLDKIPDDVTARIMTD